MLKAQPDPRGHVLAIDVGTSVVRVSAVSLTGEVLASVRAACRPEVSGDFAVLDAEALWTDLCRLLREIADAVEPADAGGEGEVEPAAGGPGEIAGFGRPVALGVSCLISSILVDEALNPVAPAILWSDRRASAEAAELDLALGARAGELAGRRPSPELLAPRLRWMARHQPAAWARARWAVTLKDWVVARLTGVVVTDPTSASYSLLFDVHRRAWSPELCAAADVPIERLPPVRHADESAGGLTAEAAAATGLPAGLPVTVGGPDGSVATLGCGAVRAGVTCDVAGTTDVVLHAADHPVTDPQRRVILNAGLLPGIWTVGGPTGLTGGALPWLAGVLGFGSVEAAYAALAGDLAAVGPGAGGVTVHTTLSGERFPTWATGSTGSIAGLRPEHGPAHLLRAAEEGAAFAVREGLDAMAGLGLEIGEVRICGGLARRADAMQQRADAWNRPVVGVSNPEATTLGAAMLAAVCGGAFPTVDAAAAAMVRLDAVITPQAAVTAAYDAAYGRWLATRVE